MPCPLCWRHGNLFEGGSVSSSWTKGTLWLEGKENPCHWLSLPGIESATKPLLSKITSRFLFLHLTVDTVRSTENIDTWTIFEIEVGAQALYGKVCMLELAWALDWLYVLAWAPFPAVSLHIALVFFRASKSFLCFRYLFWYRCPEPISDPAMSVFLWVVTVCIFSKISC